MDILVYEYLLTPPVFSAMWKHFFIDHIMINYPLLECGNWIHNCICAGSGCHILQTIQKPSIWNHEVDVWGKESSNFNVSSSFHSMFPYIS